MAKINFSQKMPEKYEKQQGILLYYNDIIVDLLQLGNEYNLTQTKIELSDTSQLDRVEDNEILDWMMENGYKNEAIKVIRSHVFFSLLNDFILYMHESFSCAERGVITVAYTISRKPIKDTLFYLCWLLADEEELINKIMYKDTSEYDPTKIPSDKKKEVIDKVVLITGNTFASDLIYELIYSRKMEGGLSAIWDKTLHLVTGNKDYPTAKGNLNFIFEHEESWHSHWDYYYRSMPIIMKIAIEVIVRIFEKIFQPSANIAYFNKYIRDMKFIRSSGTNNPLIENNIRDLIVDLKIECESCSENYSINPDEFIEDYLISCPKCGCSERVGQYFHPEYKDNKRME